MQRLQTEINIFETTAEMARAAALLAADHLRTAIANNGQAYLIAAGASQLELLDVLVQQPLDWAKVTMFHLDEYVGLPETHIASFRKYLKEKLTGRVPMARRIPSTATSPTPARSAAASARRSANARSTWRWSASARTVTWPSTTRRRTSQPTSPT